MIIAAIAVSIASGCAGQSMASSAPPAGLLSLDPSAPATASPEPAMSAVTSPEPAQSGCVEAEPDREGGIDWFNGTCHGLRLARHDVIEAEGLHAFGLRMECESKEYGEGHPTDLDFELGYLPDGADVDFTVKHACGSMGLSVRRHLAFDHEGAFPSGMTIERELYANPTVEIDATMGSVTACDVLGTPAVCVDYFDDPLTRRNGYAMIVVIEDGSLDPHGTVLRVWAEEVPFAELVKVAEGIVRA